MEKNDETNENSEEVPPNSSTAENIIAYKELLSSKEAKDFATMILDRVVIISGKAPQAQMKYLLYNSILMVVAFTCIGVLAYKKLIPDGTTGVLSGIIIGYFFKREGRQ